jgi:hypothetical protein
VLSPPAYKNKLEPLGEFGRSMGGPVLIASKSGTNSVFHGSSFEYFIADGSVPVFFKLTPRSLSFPDMASSWPNGLTGLQPKPITTEIDWYQRWLSRRLPEVPNRGPFQCCKPVAQTLEADWHQQWLQRVIPAVPNDGPFQCCKPRDPEIDWQQRWLKRTFEKDPTTTTETPSPGQPDYSLSRQSEEHP